MLPKVRRGYLSPPLQIISPLLWSPPPPLQIISPLLWSPPPRLKKSLIPPFAKLFFQTLNVVMLIASANSGWILGINYIRLTSLVYIIDLMDSNSEFKFGGPGSFCLIYINLYQDSIYAYLSLPVEMGLWCYILKF